MRRRTFLAALPLAAAGSASFGNSMPGSPVASMPNGAQPAETQTALPKFQAPGEERFLRPDVHAGDRPSGASFASRSPALGCSGAAGTAHPIATQVAIEMLKRGGSAVDAAVAANACLGFVEPTSSGLGGDCYAMLWDPKQSKVDGYGQLRPIARSRSRWQQPDRARRMACCPSWARSPCPRPARSTAGGRCISATASSSGPSSLSLPSTTAKPARPCRRSSASTSSATGHLSAPGFRRRRDRQRRAHLRARRQGSQRIRCLSQSRPGAHLSHDRRRRPRRLLRRAHREDHRRLLQAHRRMALRRRPARTSCGVD